MVQSSVSQNSLTLLPLIPFIILSTRRPSSNCRPTDLSPSLQSSTPLLLQSTPLLLQGSKLLLLQGSKPLLLKLLRQVLIFVATPFDFPNHRTPVLQHPLTILLLLFQGSISSDNPEINSSGTKHQVWHKKRV